MKLCIYWRRRNYAKVNRKAFVAYTLVKACPGISSPPLWFYTVVFIALIAYETVITTFAITYVTPSRTLDCSLRHKDGRRCSQLIMLLPSGEFKTPTSAVDFNALRMKRSHGQIGRARISASDGIIGTEAA